MAMASMSHNLQGTAMPITDDMWSDLWGIPAPGSNLDFTFDYVDLEADLYRMPTLALQSAQCLTPLPRTEHVPPLSPEENSGDRFSDGSPPYTEADDDENADDSMAHPLRDWKKKAAHNATEKRYRSKMSAKFLALEEAMRAARLQTSGVAFGRGSTKSKNGGFHQSKSEILADAVAYIHWLQEEKASLHNELVLLKTNLLPRKKRDISG